MFPNAISFLVACGIVVTCGCNKTARDRSVSSQSTATEQPSTATGLSRAASESHSPIRLINGKPVLVRKATPIVPAGTQIKDTPDGKFILADYVKFIPEGKQEWAFEIRPIGKTQLRLSYGPTNNTDKTIVFASDQTAAEVEAGKHVFPEVSYKVFNRQGGELFQWSAED